MLSEQREMRLDFRSLRDDLHLFRGEFGLLREQVRIQGVAITRLEDTLTFNVLDRLQSIESRLR